ncbi:MAG: hypothetical protein C0501_27625 [Isosphaera sp.]|nr:hypothetical protein [Isosphaera sp.]
MHMLARLLVLAALSAAVSAGPAGAALIIVDTNNLGPATSSLVNPANPGSISFNLVTSTDPTLPSEMGLTPVTGDTTVNVTTTATTIDFTGYRGFSSSGPDTFVNANIDYDLVVTLGEAVAGDIGTIDVLGRAQGGGNPVLGSTTIDDIFSFSGPGSLGGVIRVNEVSLTPLNLEVNNTLVFARFAFARPGNMFLNVTLFDPNPDLDPNPQRGLSLSQVMTTGAPLAGFQLITAAPTTPRTAAGLAVPEPASVGLLAVGAAGLAAVRRRFRNRAA